MKELEIKVALESAIKNFEENYPEWADYTLAPKKDGMEVEVISDGNKLDIQASKELLRDFAVELKEQNLMVTSQHQGDFAVGEYVYTFEEGLEDLADELELKLGNYFSNLSVSARDNKPYVRFVYIGSLTSKDKEKLLDQVKTITEQYKPIDPDDIFSDVEFEELDEVLEEIEGKDFDDMVEAESEELKAEDLDISEMENPDIWAHAKIMSKELGRDVPMQEARWDLTYNDPVGYKLHIARIAAGKELMEHKKAKGEDTYEAVDGVSEGHTCEEIAEMHGVDLDFIMDQLEKGIKIEMEHTDDPEEAKAIAKDHLFEIPDYYDRLMQMEKEAETEPMLSDGTNEEDDNFTIDSSEEIDEEGAMARVQLTKIIENAEELLELLEDESQLPAWVQSKLTLADHHLEASADYLSYEDENEGYAQDETANNTPEINIEVVDGIEFEMHDYHFEKFPRAVREVKRAAIIYFTQQNDFDGSDIKKVLCHDTYFDLESNNENVIKSGPYKLAMKKQVAQGTDGQSQVEYEYELVSVQKAEDDYEVKENIRVTPENDELIWKAERDLIKAINDGDFKKAQSLFDFIYNFDILTASETMGQFEDLWNRRNDYQEELYELSLYEMFDEYDN